MDDAFWNGRRVLVTGHTGFKGAWLSTWLADMGAVVRGLALPPEGEPNLFDLLQLSSRIESELFDINDADGVRRTLSDFQPEVVLHLAAQSLVRPSYEEPVQTFATNVLGTVTLLDAVRESPSVRSVVVVTSDKCYENLEQERAYHEGDRLGGRDPYSASKGCAEIAARSMQLSFFAPYAPNGHPARIASVRAGNVIGGGDWARDRLVPDIIAGCLGSSGLVEIRNPRAVRPWQHVLEPLSGYLSLAQRLIEAPDRMDEAWNFGPSSEDCRPVSEVAEAIVQTLGRGTIETPQLTDAPHEAHLLRLDSTKARRTLGWKPMLTFDETVRWTADWYLAWDTGDDMRAFTSSQIADYLARMRDATGHAEVHSAGTLS